MALSENIPYIYDSKQSANGVLWGSTLKYILSLGDKQRQEPYSGINVLNECCFLKPGALAPFSSQCLVKESNSPVTSLGALFSSYNTNIGYFLCDSGWQAAEQNNNLAYINNARSIDLKTGQARTYPMAYNVLPTARVAVGNVDLSHYLIVPTIQACAAGAPSQVITTDLKTYKNQYSASHPHIRNITYRVYYKADLSSTAQASATGIRLWGTIQNNSLLNWQRDSSPTIRVNKFATKFSSQRLLPINALYYPPTLRLFKMPVPTHSSISAHLPSLVCDVGLSSTHGSSVHSLAFNNSDIQQATLAYAYITLGTAVSIISSVGMWYAESVADTADAHGSLTTSASVYAPVINENGTPTGSISGGGVTDVEDSPIYQTWGDQNNNFPIGGNDAMGAKQIDPRLPTPPDTSQTQKPLTIDDEDPDVMPQTPKLNGLGVFSNYYAIAKNGVDQLNDFLWNSDETVVDDLLNSLKLFGQSPIDAIISLRLYPFNFMQLLPSTAVTEEIVLGRVATGVTAWKLPSDCATTLNLGSIYLPRKYGNFLDYAPYSSYSLYIPFCGVVNLNPNIFLDHYVSVRMVVDVTTGKCTAIIYVGSDDEYGVPIQYVDGMIGVEVPITAENMGKLGAAVLEAVGNTAAAAVSTGVAGGAFAAVGGAIDVMFADVAPQKTGSVSASGSLSMPIKLYVAISSPHVVVPENYGHTKGYATDKTINISGQSGFTVCYNVDTSSIAGATDAERSEIKSLLEGGIYT